MPRIAGVDIPERKKVRYALRYIHGIGPKFADEILAKAGVDPEKKASELTEPDVSQIATVIDEGYIVEGALKRQVGALCHEERLACQREDAWYDVGLRRSTRGS